jgi:hypothetical protein
MRVVETLLASFIFISALTFVNTFFVLPSSPKYEVTDLEKMGHNALHDLDDQRILSDFVYNEKWDDLQLALMTFLSPDIYFNLTIYDLDHNIINGETRITYGTEDTFETWTTSIMYTLSGYQSQYDPRILLLELVRS